jgi:hypothetical protein
MFVRMTVPTTDALLHGEYTPTPTAPAASEPAEWRPATRVAFRFAFAYTALFIAPLGPLGLTALAKLVARHVFGVAGPIPTAGNGSGDRLIDWVTNLCILVLAVVATVVWSALDRRREYSLLHDRLRVVLRYGLGVTMCTYGAAKVFQSQFPAPSLERLVEPYGQSSPMGLVWTFMGYSYAYNLYAGLAEMAGGILLFWRRTTTLGALVGAAVLTNVVMINLAYDVPVKRFSAHLLAAAILLAIPDVVPLARLLVGGRGATLAEQQPRGRLWLPRRLRLGIKALVIVAAVGGPLGVSASTAWRFRAGAPKPPLYGVYDVTAR